MQLGKTLNITHDAYTQICTYEHVHTDTHKIKNKIIKTVLENETFVVFPLLVGTGPGSHKSTMSSK